MFSTENKILLGIYFEYAFKWGGGVTKRWVK